MLAGISAADVLFADLGIDPCRGGCHWFEATDFLVKRRQPDVAAHVILWQIGVLNQHGFTAEHRYRSDLRPLQETLLNFYPPEHTVIHYQAAQQVVQAPLIERLALSRLDAVQATGASTLVLPPLLCPDGKDQRVRQPFAAAPMQAEPSPSGRLSDHNPSALARMIEHLATNPSSWLAYQRDRGEVLARSDLDPVERWALLRRHAPLIRKSLELGSARQAAVSLGIAPTEAEAEACCRRWLERSDQRRLQLQDLQGT